MNIKKINYIYIKNAEILLLSLSVITACVLSILCNLLKPENEVASFLINENATWMYAGVSILCLALTSKLIVNKYKVKKFPNEALNPQLGSGSDSQLPQQPLPPIVLPLDREKLSESNPIVSLGQKRPISEGPSVMFVTNKMTDGWGDVSLTYQIAQTFCETMRVPFEKVTVCACIRPGEEETLKTRFSNFFHFRTKVVSNLNADLIGSLMQELHTTHMVFCSSRREAVEGIMRNSRIPMMAFSENGWEEFAKEFRPDIPSYVMGPQDGGVGVILDEDLASWFRQRPTLDDRMQLLSRLPEELQRAITGSLCTPDTLRTFSGTYSLYSANYTYSVAARQYFVMSMALAQETLRQTKNLCFVFANSFSSGWEDAEFLDILRSHNVKTLEIVHGNIRTTRDLVPAELREEGRHIRLVFTGDISRESFKILMKASEAESVITGDGTLGEALSVGNLMHYECRLHKKNVLPGLWKREDRTLELAQLHRDAFRQHISKKSTVHQHYTSPRKINFGSEGLNRIENPIDYRKLADFFVQYRARPEMQMMHREYIEYVHDRISFAQQLPEIMAKAGWIFTPASVMNS